MRILFVNEKCGFYGGVEQNVHEVATGLVERGHETFLAYSESTTRDGNEYRRPFRVARSSAALAGESPGTGPDLDELVEHLDPQVIYVHRVARVTPVLEAAQGRPVVRMIHDHDVYCPRRHKYHAVSGQVCTRAAGLACFLDLAFLERDRGSTLGFRYSSIMAKLRELESNRKIPSLVVASRYMRDQLVENGFDLTRVRVVAPAVRSLDTPWSPPPSRGRLLYVGQLIRGKGVDLLLDAVAGVHGPWELQVVGEGNARPALEAQARALGVADRVLFRGWISPPELREVYHCANVVVVPSRWPEPFGMVGLEAMRAGRPVVGFAVGGIPDWLEDGETGKLVPPGDTVGLRHAISDLVHDPVRADAMGRVARAVVDERFSFERMLDGLEDTLGIRTMASLDVRVAA